MKSVTLFVQGRPQGKGRPRMTRAGRVYTPPATRDYERRIRNAWTDAAGDFTFGPLPVRVTIRAVFPIPKSATKARRERMAAGLEIPMKKPDIDNICKAVMDGLNGAAYQDDAQVVSVRARKQYGTDPGLEVTVSDYVL